MTLTSRVQRIGDTAVLRVAGCVESGGDLDQWRDALQVASMLGTGPIVVDLGELEAWSTAAQATLLTAARRATACGRTVALFRPTPQLRACTRIPVFERIREYDDALEAVTDLRFASVRRRESTQSVGRRKAADARAAMPAPKSRGF